MTTEQIVTIGYLAVSALSLLVQTRHLHRMAQAKAGLGLTRTAVCRVACSVLYVIVGVNALAVHWAVIQLTFAVYATTAITWWVNSIADERLTRPATVTSGRSTDTNTTETP